MIAETRKEAAAYEIINRKRATYCCNRYFAETTIVKAILRDETSWSCRILRRGSDGVMTFGDRCPCHYRP